MVIVFVRGESKLHVWSDDDQHVATFPAANNASHGSRGPWPAGVYEGGKMIEVGGPDGEPGGSYGRLFLRFPTFEDVDGEIRSGMGIHAGRDGRADKAGREGFRHATMGCIRTTAAAMEALAQAVTGERVLLAVFD